MSIIYFLIVGLIAGWAAGKIFRGAGFGLTGNLIVGVLGAIIGGFLFPLFKLLPVGIVGELIAAIVGALILLVLIQILKKK